MLYFSAIFFLLGWVDFSIFFFCFCYPCLCGPEFFEQEDISEAEILTYELPPFETDVALIEYLYWVEVSLFDEDFLEESL